MSIPHGRDESERLLGALPEGILSKGKKLRAKYALDTDDFEKELCDSFEEEVVTVYRNFIEAVLPDRMTIALKLKMSKGNRSKWRKKKVDPGWDTLFLALAAFDVDFGVRPLPSGRAALSVGMRQTVTWIRKQKIGEDCTVLTREQMEYLHYACQSLAWARAQRSGLTSELRDAARGIDDLVRKQLLYDVNWDYLRIQDAVYDWAPAWFIFHATIPFLDWVF